jgi:hypothetical protein
MRLPQGAAHSPRPIEVRDIEYSDVCYVASKYTQLNLSVFLEQLCSKVLSLSQL